MKTDHFRQAGRLGELKVGNRYKARRPDRNTYTITAMDVDPRRDHAALTIHMQDEHDNAWWVDVTILPCGTQAHSAIQMMSNQAQAPTTRDTFVAAMTAPTQESELETLLGWAAMYGTLTITPSVEGRSGRSVQIGDEAGRDITEALVVGTTHTTWTALLTQALRESHTRAQNHMEAP